MRRSCGESWRSYPERSGRPPVRASRIERDGDKRPEVSRGHSRRPEVPVVQGPNVSEQVARNISWPKCGRNLMDGRRRRPSSAIRSRQMESAKSIRMPYRPRRSPTAKARALMRPHGRGERVLANRRMRTRTSGGVGGALGNGRPYPIDSPPFQGPGICNLRTTPDPEFGTAPSASGTPCHQGHARVHRPVGRRPLLPRDG